MKKGLPQPFWLSLGCFLELGRLSYLIWKRTFRAIYWYKNFSYSPTDRYYLNVFWCPADLNKLPSTFWSATLQPVVADQDFMPHIKAKHVPFQIMHGSFICQQRLQSGKPKCWITLSDFLFPFHNLTWGFCFCLHIIPLFCRFGGDKHPITADISFYPNSMGKTYLCE